MNRPKIDLTPELIENLKTLTICDHDEYGREVPNPVPLFANVDIDAPPPLTLQERIQRCLRSEFSRQAYDKGFESEAEANDFTVGDDFDADLPVTPYEMTEEVLPEPEVSSVEPSSSPAELPEPEVLPDDPSSSLEGDTPNPA